MLEFIVVAEAEADAQIACGLADRVFVENGPEWIDETWLPNIRIWTGVEVGTSYTRLPDIKKLGEKYNLPRYRAHFDDAAKGSEAATLRKAVFLALKLQRQRPIKALMLVRDLDSQAQRRDKMMQARDELKQQVAIVLATPKWKREAWVLNGFVCADQNEEQLLESLRKELGFDPCLEAERLRYSSQTSKSARDPKRIVMMLTSNNFEREQQCWAETALAILRGRGQETYLKDFLQDIEDELLPLLTQ